MTMFSFDVRNGFTAFAKSTFAQIDLNDQIKRSKVWTIRKMIDYGTASAVAERVSCGGNSGPQGQFHRGQLMTQGRQSPHSLPHGPNDLGPAFPRFAVLRMISRGRHSENRFVHQPPIRLRHFRILGGEPTGNLHFRSEAR
jgi:hypothetical protein